MTRKITIEQKWHQQSEAAKSEAEKLPHGKEREALVRKARQLHTASQMNEWLSSPGYGRRSNAAVLSVMRPAVADTGHDPGNNR
jgi:hypothetical protein